MHYTSPAHPQEKKQEYQIDYPQRLVYVNLLDICSCVCVCVMCVYMLTVVYVC